MRVFRDECGLRFGWILALIFGGIVAGVIVLGVAVRGFDHWATQRSCPERGEAMGMESKFVDYTFWSYECLVQLDDGRWVGVDKVRGTAELDVPR